MTKLQPKLSAPVIREVTGTQVNQEGITAQITNRLTGESRIGSRGNTFAGDDAE
jgi:prenylated cyclic peptide (anacyclamide/piricyclamide family)